MSQPTKHTAPTRLVPSSADSESRRGMTLLELLLALALSAVVFGLIGVALNQNLRTMNTGRTRAEEVLLARAILNMIADDLRAAVHHNPPDTESLKELASGFSLEDALAEVAGDLLDSAGIDPAEIDVPEDLAGALSGNASASDTGDDLFYADEEAVSNIPGLFGSMYELQIDVSRPPRPDQQVFVTELADTDSSMSSGGLGANQPLGALPSGIQRVRYYIDNSDMVADQLSSDLTMDPTATNTAQVTTGLIRRAVDRSIAGFSLSGSGLEPILGEQYQVLASEVASIQFRYFDGFQWREEWSSSEEMPLPMAVEIILSFLPPANRNTSASVGDMAAAPVIGGLQNDLSMFNNYRLVVQMPTVEMPLEQPGLYSSEDSSGETSGGSSSSVSSSGSGASSSGSNF